MNNGEYVHENTRIPYGAVLQYSCLDGRKFQDGYNTKFIQCIIGTGEWDYDDMTCECEIFGSVQRLFN